MAHILGLSWAFWVKICYTDTIGKGTTKVRFIYVMRKNRRLITMKIIKRNGTEVEFDVMKIINAISKANVDGVQEDLRLSDREIEFAAYNVKELCEGAGHTVSVEEIQDMVEDQLMALDKFEVARKYIIYRYVQGLKRHKNTTDDKILSLIDCTNEEVKQENSNKNPTVVSVQRDYMAGEVSRDLTDRKLLPEDVVKAHEEGLIHFHDSDYYAQRMHNCFSGNTRFITDKGIRKFSDFHDGDTVIVKDKDGVLREATVHRYGKQLMQEVTLRSGHRIEKIRCTANHRWILDDGSVTTDLKIGDCLYPLHDSTAYDCDADTMSYDEANAFCMGFVVGDGCDHTDTNQTCARLCGDKKGFADIFKKAGFKVADMPYSSDLYATRKYCSKESFLTGTAWKFMPADLQVWVFRGLYAADGDAHEKVLVTTDSRVRQMIEDLSGLAGYYISSSVETVRDASYKTKVLLKIYHFVTQQLDNSKWCVTDIREDSSIGHFHNAWCVEEPVTHSFTLAHGVVTGNCDLVNLDDMLQNGTVISGTMIERPHSFSTACNIATQIIAQVASCQYGGQSITLSHLSPFVDVSRKKIARAVDKEMAETGIDISDEQKDEIVEARLRDEVRRGVQTIQYQVVTLMTTNGQAPFITVFMYLDEVPEGQPREDLAMVIEEVLRQRYQGVKNEKGVWVTPAFPKLIYCLDEDNIHKDSKYYYLTELAAKCTAKRMVPDYISAKKMHEYKLSKGEIEGAGDVYTPMGCVDRAEVVAYRFDGQLYVESIGRMWERMADISGTKLQPGRTNDFYCDLDDVLIYDTVNGWTPCHRIIRNADAEFLNVRLSNGRELVVTPDHPFETENRGLVYAEDLTCDDIIRIDRNPIGDCKDKPFDVDEAWLLGLIVCVGSYDKHLSVSFDMDANDVRDHFSELMLAKHNFASHVFEHHCECKGTHQDVYLQSTQYDSIVDYCDKLKRYFGGTKKMDRQLPHDYLDWSRPARLALLAGMMDADGYVRPMGKRLENQASIGSTNKALAIQQMLLIQSLGMPAYVVHNLYKGSGRADTVRYAINFKMTQEIIDAMHCAKKKARYNPDHRINASGSDFASVVSVDITDYCNYSYDVTTESEHFTVSGVWSHNCRSFLTPDRSGNGYDNVARAKNYDPTKPKYYGRFNQGVVTINLPDVALSSGGDMDKFWEIFDERLELCHKALRCRHDRLCGTVSDAAPILWQYGALARLDKGETIDKLLYGGYSTISLGYAGLYECVKYMTGKSHTDEEAKPFALAVMQRLNDKCNEWKQAEDIDYSPYGTPLESTTYKFAKCLQKRFGIVKGITDHGYITNSYHVNVRENIDAFTKLKFESDFQRLSPGGAISYVEVPDMQDNLEAVLSVMQFIYDNIMYAELNTKSDYCQVCGYDGEIQIVEDDGKYIWECPHCGNRDQSKMNVARRTCGYIGTQFWNQGRTEEIKDRVMHL